MRLKLGVSAIAIGLALVAVLGGCSANPLAPVDFSVLKTKATAEDKVPGLSGMQHASLSKSTMVHFRRAPIR